MRPRSSERELAPMEVEMLSRVPVHLLEGHVVGEERIPAGREVHAATEVGL